MKYDYRIDAAEVPARQLFSLLQDQGCEVVSVSILPRDGLVFAYVVSRRALPVSMAGGTKAPAAPAPSPLDVLAPVVAVAAGPEKAAALGLGRRLLARFRRRKEPAL